MAIAVTTIGAYPKPDYLPLSDWFQGAEGPDAAEPTAGYLAALAAMGAKAEALFERAVGEVVREQVACGVDIPTDGEIPRENYIHYHCRHLSGIDFADLTERAVRGGAYRARLPTISGPISARDHFLAADWRRAQKVTDRPVKMTLPGPMTIVDTTANRYYDDEKRLGADLAQALNAEVRDLAAAGCRWIQIDEPVFARKPDQALAYGVDNLAACFDGLPSEVTRVVHMCCGYPDRLDREDYPKADRSAYFRLAEAMDAGPFDAVSIEDAHRHNDLNLLELFPRTTVILGLVAVARSRVETVEEIRARLGVALDHIDAARLIAAPDCGLGLLGRELAVAKLKNLAAAASSF